MNDVPLIQKADINSINTSIIAIKKQLKQLTEAVGLIDVPDIPDLSPFVKKTDVADVVEADNMNPVTSNAVAEYTVDEVTSGNMHSVTSNAVANAVNQICVGCCCLDKETRSYTTNNSFAILGAYGRGLFNFAGIQVPSGWHKEFVLSAQVNTSGNGNVRVRLNNITTGWGGTWASQTFRNIVVSPRFKEGDVTLEPTLNYTSKQGTNLYIQTTGITSTGVCFGVYITCFLVKDT